MSGNGAAIHRKAEAYIYYGEVFKVVAQSPSTQVPNKEGTGQTAKCTLQALGGKYEDCLAVTLFGNTALCKFHPGDTVLAKLRFQAHEHNGAWYQDVFAKEIMTL